MIKRPDFVEFILEDTHSRVLRDYINDLENRINNTIEYLESTPKVTKSIHFKDKDNLYVFIEKEIKNNMLDILGGNND